MRQDDPPLPRVIGRAELPEAVLLAEAAAGTLRPCGPAFLPCVQPETAAARALALASRLRPGIVITGRSAAWVWGALRRLPEPLELAVPRERRLRLRLSLPHRLRELALPERELRRWGPATVTSPERTRRELLAAGALGPAERVAVRLLAAYPPVTR